MRIMIRHLIRVSACWLTMTAFAPACPQPQDGASTDRGVISPDAIVESLELPAQPGSRFPNASTGWGDIVLISWLQPGESDSFRLLYCEADLDRVSTARQIADGTHWFVNWADFPSLTAGSADALVAHWLERNGEATYAYGVRISCSTDRGVTWSKPAWLHDDTTENEHGFVSIVPGGERDFTAIWLDSRDAAATGNMAMWTRSLSADGEFGPEKQLDPRVCSCCQTAILNLNEEVLVTYRDRSDTEIRDISAMRWTNESGWREPQLVARDDWFVPS